ncbi:alpha-2-macroglobulin family protein [Flammeovirga sp. SJP92]|uniref:alpha-2-macroglobulin family protein n=1 Tax=Flammeovirga sp. SJP92 TaxID=1775430 RepID=UPI00155F59E3|nr:alpha-2-macroglobulin family protein [Flammeovirga sp. SJP92]
MTSKLKLLLFFLCISISVFSQDLLNSRRSSYYTYIYKITNQEAEKIYQDGIYVVDQSFYHTLIDSIASDSFPNDLYLPLGHYLITEIVGNEQYVELYSEESLEVFVLNNDKDLVVQVYDLKGNCIEGATVKVNNKTLRFDEERKAYIDKKSNKKGLLKVSYDGYVSYRHLNRRVGNSVFKRGWRKVVNGTPLKYVYFPIYYVVYLPVRYVVHLPIDGVKSIKYNYPRGTIYRTKEFAIKTADKVARCFDGNYRNNNHNYYNKYNGYFVFNKPIYKPAEKVRFKAYIVNKKNGKPYSKVLTAYLYGYGKEIDLGEIMPYEKGGYSFEFDLSDSLELKLDKRYSIELRDRKGRTVTSGFFSYEEYELGKNQLEVRVDNHQHYRNKDFKLFVKGTDENDLNLKDATVEVTLTSNAVDKYHADSVFVPNTLYKINKKLSSSGETELLLSDQSFPKADFEYEVSVKMRTSDNEVKIQKEKVNYFYNHKEITSNLEGENLSLNYLVNGEVIQQEGKVYGIDAFGNKTLEQKGALPFQVPVTPYYRKYLVETSDGFQEQVAMRTLKSSLQVFTERTADSIKVKVDNPRNLPFNYTLYKINKVQEKGYGQTLSFNREVKNKKNYYLTVNYLWAGELKTENYLIPSPNELQLDLKVNVPKLVTPGQKATFEVQVTDYKGKPVEGVDITALGITNKFKYTPQKTPSFSKKKKRGKSLINNFSLDHEQLISSDFMLDYATWKVLAGLDSIPYYNFLYPENKIYQATYSTESQITQFIPYVVYKGEIEPIHVIYIDHVPVYFGWTTISKPYSIRVASGKHNVRLRTAKHEVTLKDYEFEEGKKTILSVDRSYSVPNMSVMDKSPYYTESELRWWSKYTMIYKNDFKSYAYLLEENKDVYLLSPTSAQQYQFAGPVIDTTTLKVLGEYERSFQFEPNYLYEFSEEYIKMKSFDFNSQLLEKNISARGFYEEILTEEKVKQYWEEDLYEKRRIQPVYVFPESTEEHQGKLKVSFRSTLKQKDNPLNKLLVKLDDPQFMRVYPGNTTVFHALDSGYYQLIYFYSENRYHIEDSLKVQERGTNHFIVDCPQEYKQDEFGKKFSKIIEKLIYPTETDDLDKTEEWKEIQNSFRETFSSRSDGKIVQGIVTDSQVGPIPGVTVMVEGTTHETITDFQGYFSLSMPKAINNLIFKSIGYESKTVLVDGDFIEVEMFYDQESLEEVVVIGYGTTRKRFPSNAAIPVHAQVSGITIDETSTGLKIKEVNSIEGVPAPLYVINGKIYTGDVSKIDPNLIQKYSILRDARSTSIYGSRGANGVVLIEMSSSSIEKLGLKLGGNAEVTNDFMAQAQKRTSIRNNFKDDAFWQPKLKSDKNGKVKFEVTFPDDITKWDTHFLAMNGKKQSGYAEENIKSYMPLTGQVNLPRFLVASDQVKAVGKSLNYMGDTLQSDIVFSIDKKKQWEKSVIISDVHIDTLTFTSTNDSVALSYTVNSQNGFFDGEERTIPVYPLGLEVAKGDFYVLENDTTIQLQSNDGPTKLYAKSSYLGALESEIEHVVRYRYLCNEQLASKLKAHLSAYTISQYKEQKYENTAQIEKLLTKLSKKRNEAQLWGWWEGNSTSNWISIHVLEALAQARELGFIVPINTTETIERLLVSFQSDTLSTQKLKTLQLVYALDPQGNYQKQVHDLDKIKTFTFYEQLQLMRMKQKAGLSIEMDSIKRYRQETMFGNIYFENEEKGRVGVWSNRITDNALQNTLLVYQIYRDDSLYHNENEMRKMRNYLLEKRKAGYWNNTYTSSKVIETILPDVIKHNGQATSSTLILSGSKNGTITQFPLELDLQKGEELTISKKGDFPIYLTQYSNYWESSPLEKSDHFEVNTYFEDQNTQTLKSGEKINLVVEVDVKKNADYVMVNVPIPAGCSYASKKQGLYYEVHREYFKNEVAIFCKKLNKGNYTFTVELLPRYTGEYHLNPAKAELMYFPTFYGNNELKEVGIQ